MSEQARKVILLKHEFVVDKDKADFMVGVMNLIISELHEDYCDFDYKDSDDGVKFITFEFVDITNKDFIDSLIDQDGYYKKSLFNVNGEFEELLSTNTIRDLTVERPSVFDVITVINTP